MISLTIPLPEKVSSNAVYSGMHWTKRKKIADLYHRFIRSHLVSKALAYPVDIQYDFRFKSRALDTTNCFFMAKMIEDSLVNMGTLDDDDPKHVRATTITSKKGDRDEVEINIVWVH